MFHSFDEVDVDLTTWGSVAQRDRQWHAEEEFTIVGRVELRNVIDCDRGVVKRPGFGSASFMALC